MTTEQEYIQIRYPSAVTYTHSIGYQSKFAHGLKRGSILATKCPKCQRAMVPPRVVCPFCHVRASEWVDQGQRGRLISAFKVDFPMYDRKTDQLQVPEYPMVAVELEGSARIDGWCSETDVNKLKVGLFLEAVWKPEGERGGRIDDILYWKPVAE